MKTGRSKVSLPSLSEIGRLLRKQGGAPPTLPPRTPFEWVLWENVAYLPRPGARTAAFAVLRRTIGTTAAAIARATDAALQRVTSHGIMAAMQARKLRRIGDIALDRFDGDLDSRLSTDVAVARRQLRAFPAIGEPGALKILVAMGRTRALPLDSNGVRVLVRIGIGRALKSYALTYRSVQAAVDVGRASSASLHDIHLMLQRHGREVCRANRPLCGNCLLRPRCAHGRLAEPGASFH